MDKATPQDDDGEDRRATVGKCFKLPSDFVKAKVESVVKDYYHGSYANLCLIEIAFYDHNLILKRNAHKAFLNALIAWKILEVENDEELSLILFGVKDKHKRLPKTGGYMDWTEESLQDERNICIGIGQELGKTIPYRYKKLV